MDPKTEHRNSFERIRRIVLCVYSIVKINQNPCSDLDCTYLSQIMFNVEREDGLIKV